MCDGKRMTFVVFFSKKSISPFLCKDLEKPHKVSCREFLRKEGNHSIT